MAGESKLKRDLISSRIQICISRIPDENWSAHQAASFSGYDTRYLSDLHKKEHTGKLSFREIEPLQAVFRICVNCGKAYLNRLRNCPSCSITQFEFRDGAPQWNYINFVEASERVENMLAVYSFDSIDLDSLTNQREKEFLKAYFQRLLAVKNAAGQIRRDRRKNRRTNDDEKDTLRGAIAWHGRPSEEETQYLSTEAKRGEVRKFEF